MSTVSSSVTAERTSSAVALREPRDRGDTVIDDGVISIIARMAAEQVDGVHKIGDSSLRNLLSRFGRHQGVGAEVGLRQAAVDVEISVEFGYQITEVAGQMRERIVEAVESMTGRDVVEVNVFVVDVHVPKTQVRRHRELQ